MYARVLTWQNARDVDGALTFLKEKVVPLANEQKGYKGVTASADRSSAIFGVLSLWDSAEARESSFGAFAKVREESEGIIGGSPLVENFERTVFEIGSTPPSPGSALLLQRISIDPATVDDNLDFFRSEIVPQITGQAGFRGLQQLINRQTGDGIVGSAWADRAVLDAAAEAALARRSLGTARAVSFGETSEREILFTDLR